MRLADLLRKSLGSLVDWEKKQKAIRETAEHYQAYLSLGGVSTKEIEAFLKGEVERDGSIDICQAIATYTNTGRLEELVTDAAANVPVGDKKYDFYVEYGGTAYTPGLWIIETSSGAPFPYALTRELNDYLWGGDHLGLASYRGEIHLLYYRDFRHPIKSISLDGDKLCSFKADTSEKIGPNATEPELCRLVLDNKRPSAIAFNGAVKNREGAFRKKYRETEATGTAVLDIANDGNPVEVTKLYMVSGAGAGCDMEFYELLDENGTNFSSSPLRQSLLKMHSTCGNEANFFEYNGAIYYEGRPKYGYFDKNSQYHPITKIKDGQIIDVCDFQFETQVTAGE